MGDSKSLPHLTAGFAGGLTSAVILQPFDLLKTRLQQSQNCVIGHSGNVKNTTILHFKNNTAALRTIIRDMPSLRSLWTGTLPSVLRTSIGSSLYLTSLSLSRNYLARRKAVNGIVISPSTSKLPKLAMYENLLSGAAMRGLVGILTMPITVIKTRFESNLYNYRSLLQAITAIYRELNNSIRGFFLGCGSTIVRDAPYAGLYVLMYEQFKVVFPSLLLSMGLSNSAKELGPTLTYHPVIINSLSAMVAASLATIITTPFDTIKTRIQIDPAQYKNFFHALKKTIKLEGTLVLFSGAGLRLVRKTLSAGIAWGIYEEILKFF